MPPQPPLDPRRLAYLERMGIDVWVRRDLPPGEPATSAAGPEPSADVPAPNAGNPVVVSGDTASLEWETLQERVAGCRLCGLCETRTQTVFGVGNRQADLLVIGEAPGAEEDRRGEPFVGRAGKLLDNMLAALGLDRKTVYIANILKCRPPGNRDPRDEEVDACLPYLRRQVELLQPRVILAVGRVAAQNLLATDRPLRALRAGRHSFGDPPRPVVVSYHPAYLLRRPEDKAKAWDDLRRLAGMLEVES